MKSETEDRSEHIALAKPGCVHCDGTGLRSQHSNTLAAPCDCVLREIFRACLRKVRECVAGAHLMRPISADGVSRPQGRRTSFGHKQEEFCADVYLTAKRGLTNPNEWDIFRLYHLYGADWKLCCAKLDME